MSESTEHSKSIMDSLRKMVQALRHSSSQCEEFSGLTGAQFFVLKQIELGNDLSMNELATLTYTHQSSVSEVVSKLEASKLVVRRKSQADGRRVEIRITKKGLEKLSSGFMTTQEKLMQAIKSFSPDKLSHLAALLNELLHTAGLSDQNATFFFENNENNTTSNRKKK
jgi:DNA-binding MarR family transcriptional regulator